MFAVKYCSGTCKLTSSVTPAHILRICWPARISNDQLWIRAREEDGKSEKKNQCNFATKLLSTLKVKLATRCHKALMTLFKFFLDHTSCFVHQEQFFSKGAEILYFRYVCDQNPIINVFGLFVYSFIFYTK